MKEQGRKRRSKWRVSAAVWAMRAIALTVGLKYMNGATNETDTAIIVTFSSAPVLNITMSEADPVSSE